MIFFKLTILRKERRTLNDAVDIATKVASIRSRDRDQCEG